ncbi:3-keto-5-aminohexanoate cleavage protein [Pararhodobacter sp. SW119]|uniref:3-keto-5-aminohexanoate cleavage protein n=1 Tax=Pararhodobacter sp. SW119 TaxID=2780075 RepID=UPI001ADFF3B0|nr:3-keto-5-aminohexanoate cleavage protein [Pararhodobacter sp. SW119]
MSRPVVITCAITGAFGTKDRNPALPVTPEEISASALEAAAAGAAVVHIHVRDPQTQAPSMDLALYRETVERIRARNTQVILNLTCGSGARFVPGAPDPRSPGEGTTLSTPAERVAHVEALRPEIASLDVGSMNFGEHVFVNTPAHLREMAGRMRAAGAKPEIEVFDLGHIALAKKLIAEGHLDAPPLFQICLGIPYGAPATPQTLMAMQAQLQADAIWSGFGIAAQQFPMVAMVAALGGHVRVGLEDNLYLSKGQLAPGNGALVDRAATILDLTGHSVATPDEAREIFGLPA